MLKPVIARIWALWGLIIFVATLLVFVWPITFTFLIAEPNGVKAFKAVSKFWMQIFLYAIGCPMHVYNKHHYKRGEQYVVTANHRSFMDVPLLTPFFPGPNKTIAKKEMARIPLFGWVYTRGSVLVDRSSDESRKRSFEKMRRVLLKYKLCMAIYPEGTRNRSKEPLKPFYDGAFRLAVDTKKDVIPVVMRYTDVVLPPSNIFWLWPHRIEMHLLPPVSVAGKTSAQVKAEVFDVMSAFIRRSTTNPTGL